MIVRELGTLVPTVVSRAIAVAAMSAALCCATAHAATLHVTSTGDTHQNGALTSREAIAQSSAGDTIVFDVLWVMLTAGELQIAHDLTIDGGTRNISVSRDVGNAPDFRIFNVLSGNVTFNNIDIGDGNAVSSGPDVPARGGGILNTAHLVMNHCGLGGDRVTGAPGSVTVNGGTGGAAQGGALYNSGSVVLSGCTLSDDGANGGDAAQGGSGGAAEGGAIYNTGTVILDKCLITSAGALGGKGAAGSGVTSPGIGGAARGGACYNAGSLTTTNSTFFSATASGGTGGDAAPGANPGTGGDAEGGGISNHGDLQVTNVTIYQNSAGGGGYGTPAVGGQIGQRGGSFGGGIYQAATGAVHLINTVLAGDGAAAGWDVYGAVDSKGHNLIGAAEQSSGWNSTDELGTQNQRLDPSYQYDRFRDRGGPTETMVLNANSPAIDKGDDAVLSAPYNLTTDQALVPRKIGVHVDIGAIEFDPPQLDNFVVNTLTDHSDGTCGVADCTLRDAIEAANADATASTKNISFAPNVRGTTNLRSDKSYLGTMTITRPIAITGPGAALVEFDAGPGSGIFSIGARAGQVSLSGLTFSGSNGSIGWVGGAIDNHAAMVISDCVFKNNSAPGSAGAIHNEGQNNAVATMRIDRCTFSGNSAGSDGGAILNDYYATLEISNSTFVGNSAVRYGGAIYNDGSGGNVTLTVTNCTFSSNSSNAGTNGIDNNAVYPNSGIAKLTIVNTVLSGPAGGGVTLHDHGGAGQVTSLGSNVSTDAAGGDGSTTPGGLLNAPGDLRNTDPKLNSTGLRDNGGFTPTIALQPGSPAIDAGNDTYAPSTDQRGLPRAGRSDIGAYELQTAASPSASATPAPAAQSQNISTRLNVLTGDNVMIGGFIVTGTSPKKVIVRAIGPSTGLAAALADPALELHMPDGSVVTNDNWKLDDATAQSQENDIRATGVPPSDDRESALVRTLNPGNYTAIVRGKNGGTGIGLVEVYDIGDAGSTLANISTRGFVDTGDNVMIGGFIIGPPDSMPSKIAVRAIGPSIALPGALQDPLLELHDANGAPIATNDNWQDDPSAADIQTYQIAPADARESAMIRSLNPGKYTAVVRGVNATTGVGLVEVYNLR